MSHDVAGITRIWVEGLVKSFELYPLEDQSVPKPNEWSDFLRTNPQYATGKDRIFAQHLAEDRTISEAMSPDHQRLAGTLIRISFTDDQLISMLQTQ